MSTFLAVDLGASSGRVMAAAWSDQGVLLEEVHRFANGGVQMGNTLHWNAPGIWQGITDGLRRFHAQGGVAAGIGVDAWGVDFGLLDQRDRLMANPVHYRDARTHGMMERVHGRIAPEEFCARTGVQPMAINTVYQLASMVAAGDEQLQSAATLLMIPDLFQFLLCGVKRAEYTEATTTQLLDPLSRQWAGDVMARLQIPEHLFAPLAMPGTVLGPLRRTVLEECGCRESFPAIAVASHDTASAVAAIPQMDAESAFLSCGTWSLMGAQTDAIHSAAFESGFTHEGSADGGLLCLRNLTGLWILQECVRCWEAEGKSCQWDDLLRAAASAAPLQMLIDTEAEAFHAPGNMPQAIAAWCANSGQTVPQTPAEITRCVLESLALAYRRTLIDLSRAQGRRLKTVRLVGGGARNRMLCQMTADACECVVMAGPVEAAALGNVLMQAVATGVCSDLREGAEIVARKEEWTHFVPQSAEPWREAAERLAEARHKMELQYAGK